MRMFLFSLVRCGFVISCRKSNTIFVVVANGLDPNSSSILVIINTQIALSRQCMRSSPLQYVHCSIFTSLMSQKHDLTFAIFMRSIPLYNKNSDANNQNNDDFNIRLHSTISCCHSIRIYFTLNHTRYTKYAVITMVHKWRYLCNRT